MYTIGDTITYRDFNGGLRKVQVTDKDADIKNGRAGFDGVVLTGDQAGLRVWGYDDQIVR